MTSRFNVTPRAKEDLYQIWSYTHGTWNESQADSYVASIYKRFAYLAENPLLGKHRIDICEGYHCFPVGSHLVFYLIGDDEIDIIGVPHQEMDVLNYFNPQS